MASLAGMLQAVGHRVTGSDTAAYPPMSDQLAAMGIAVMEPYAAANLEPRPDLVVVGNAISRGNAELEYVLDERVPFCSMAQILHDEFLVGRESLVVAGTHGKTTTTSMLAWIYEVAGRTDARFAPSFLIGGVAENFGTSFMVRERLAGGRGTFLLEGDEYDTAFFDKGPKFLHYFPDAAILTHVEFDHADIYDDLRAVKTAFKRFVNLVPRRGRVVAFDGAENVTECVAHAFCAVERYGFAADSHWRVSEMVHEGGGVRWRLARGGEAFAELTLPMAGEHNAMNATAAAALAAGQGVPVAAIVEALGTFRSVKRRLEVRAEVGGITIIDDFAHHPTAIRETLRALRQAYPGRRLWAVLEPRSNTLRRNVFEEALVESLALADEVVIAGVFDSAKVPEGERLHPEAVAARLRERGVAAVMLKDAGAIVEAIAPRLRAGDVVGILSNGGFGGIYTLAAGGFAGIGVMVREMSPYHAERPLLDLLHFFQQPRQSLVERLLVIRFCIRSLPGPHKAVSRSVVGDRLIHLAGCLHVRHRLGDGGVDPSVIAGIKSVYRRHNLRHVRACRRRPVEHKRCPQIRPARRKRKGLAPTPAESRRHQLTARRRQRLAIICRCIQICQHLLRVQPGDRLHGRTLVWKCRRSARRRCHKRCTTTCRGSMHMIPTHARHARIRRACRGRSEPTQQVRLHHNVAFAGKLIRHQPRPVRQPKDLVNHHYDWRFTLYFRVHHPRLQVSPTRLGDRDILPMARTPIKLDLRPVLRRQRGNTKRNQRARTQARKGKQTSHASESTLPPLKGQRRNHWHVRNPTVIRCFVCCRV